MHFLSRVYFHLLKASACRASTFKLSDFVFDLSLLVYSNKDLGLSRVFSDGALPGLRNP
jgi:hypothetical protein